MIDLKDLQCLAALARNRHFARAASECGLSQPAFSMRIRNLEERLDITIVRRGNRYQGLTHEGETVLGHARQILDGVRTLEQDVRAARGDITGSLILGAIPTAAAYAAHAVIWLKEAHPGVTIRIETANSLAIQQGVEVSAFDAGITYTEGASRDLLTVDPLYDETYVLLAPTGIAPRVEGTATWQEAASLPLSLLEPSMQNRRILDRIFADAGAMPNVLVETGGFMAAIVMAVQGVAATVVPKILVESLGPLEQTAILPLTSPDVKTSICLVTPQREPQIPTVKALRSTLLSKSR
ncbi:MAG: LysR family transcriptional regulator [Pseudomonadota bacterium]